MSAILATNDCGVIKRNLMALRKSGPRAWSRLSVSLEAVVFIVRKKKSMKFFIISVLLTVEVTKEQ